MNRRTKTCLDCRHSETRAERFDWETSGGPWPHPTREHCPECGATSVRLSVVPTSWTEPLLSQAAYAGNNNGLGEYVRSKSHWNELVKKSKAIPAG